MGGPETRAPRARLQIPLAPERECKTLRGAPQNEGSGPAILTRAVSSGALRMQSDLEQRPAIQSRTRNSEEAPAAFLHIMQQWPRLPDDPEREVPSDDAGPDRWPNLPMDPFAPQAVLSPSGAIEAASGARRKALRLQRLDLEQRGGLWNA